MGAAKSPRPSSDQTPIALVSGIPNVFRIGRVADDADDPDMLEEERRLFYVALTRAKDELLATLVEEWNVANSDPWADDKPF